MSCAVPRAHMRWVVKESSGRLPHAPSPVRHACIRTFCRHNMLTTRSPSHNLLEQAREAILRIPLASPVGAKTNCPDFRRLQHLRGCGREPAKEAFP